MIVPLLLLSTGALATAQGFNSGDADRTSLIFAPSSGSLSSSPPSGPPPGTTTTTTTAHTGTGGPMIMPFPSTNGTNLVFNGTAGLLPLPSLNASHQTRDWTHKIVNVTSNGTALIASYPPLNWTLPWANATHNGTFTFPTFPAFNWTIPGQNRTQNGTIIIPPFPQLNLTIPWGNGTLNSTVVVPTFPPLNWTLPTLDHTNNNGTIVWPTLPPLNMTLPNLNLTLPATNGTLPWTLPGANVSLNGTIVFPTEFPPLNWTLPHINNTVVFPTFPPFNWTFPGLNLTNNGTFTLPTLPTFLPINVSYSTARPAPNGTMPTTTPRPFSIPGINGTARPTPIVWPWVPSSSTARPGANFSTTTIAPGTRTTSRWTPPAWSGWNRTTSMRPVSTTRHWLGSSTPSIVKTTQSPISSRSPTRSSFGFSSFGTTTTTRLFSVRTTTQLPITFGSTTTRLFPVGTSTRSPFPVTTTPSSMPNSLSDMLQSWRARFAADMEAVRANITHYLLH